MNLPDEVKSDTNRTAEASREFKPITKWPVKFRNTLNIIGDMVNFNAAYTRETSGQDGSSLILQLAVIQWVTTNQVTIKVGPAYALIFEDKCIRQAAEMGFTIRVKNIKKFNTWFKELPFFGKLPFDFSQTYLFIGAGCLVDDPNDIVGSIGAGGFRFGRGADDGS
jgi:hypothetical protein